MQNTQSVAERRLLLFGGGFSFSDLNPAEVWDKIKDKVKEAIDAAIDKPVAL